MRILFQYLKYFICVLILFYSCASSEPFIKEAKDSVKFAEKANADKYSEYEYLEALKLLEHSKNKDMETEVAIEKAKESKRFAETAAFNSLRSQIDEIRKQVNEARLASEGATPLELKKAQLSEKKLNQTLKVLEDEIQWLKDEK